MSNPSAPKTLGRSSTSHQARPTSRALPIALLRTREHVMEPLRPLLTELGLSEQKWRVLRILNESGPMEATAISRAASLLLPSLTRILRALEQDNLITRALDEGDRRRSIIRLTPQANRLIAAHLPASTAVYQRLERHLGREKLDHLLDLLEEVQQIPLTED